MSEVEELDSFALILAHALLAGWPATLACWPATGAQDCYQAGPGQVTCCLGWRALSCKYSYCQQHTRDQRLMCCLHFEAQHTHFVYGFPPNNYGRHALDMVIMGQAAWCHKRYTRQLCLMQHLARTQQSEKPTLLSSTHTPRKCF